MPNPLRLTVLIELRESAGLTQAEAAERCGLRGRQSRKTLANWELGQSTPRQRYRIPVALYLLRGLNLRADPGRFEEVFAILVDEWGWEPLEEGERRQLFQTAEEPDASPVSSVAGRSVGAEDAQGGETGQPSGTARWLTSQRFFTGATILLLALVAHVFYTRPTFLPATREPLADATATAPPSIAPTLLPSSTPTPTHTATAAPTSTPTPGPNALENLNFETGLAPWYFVGDSECVYEVVADAASSLERSHYLSVQRGSEECVSLRKELGALSQSSDRVGVALWVRSPDATPINGELVIWAGRHPIESYGAEAKGFTPFQVEGPGWHCVEVELNYNPRVEWEGWAELYFGDDSPKSYDMDAAAIRFGAGAICPPPPVALRNSSFEESNTEPEGWVWLNKPCPFSLITDATEAVDGEKYLQLQRGDKCNSIFQDVPIRPSAGQPYTARLWVKSKTGQLVGGEFAIYAIGDATHAESVVFRAGASWRCLEVSLRVPDSAYNSIRTELHLDQMTDDVVYDIDAAEVEVGETARCPQPKLALSNGDFEDDGLGGWQIASCSGEIRKSEDSHSGSQLLAVRRDAAECFSVYQDVETDLEIGDEIQAALWIRAEEGEGLGGRLALWALGGLDAENNGTDIVAEAGQWTCIETHLTVTTPGHSWLRWELYLNSYGSVYYLLDDAQLHFKGEPLCPHTDIGLRSTRIFPLRSAYFAGGMIGVDAEVQNLDTAALPEGGQLAVWVSKSLNGIPIDSALVRTAPLVSLAGETYSGRVFSDVEIPRALPPGDYFVVWEVSPPAGYSDVDERSNRDSRPVVVSACSPETRYCDVTDDSWGAAEIERWFQLKISQGCRSNTAPFQNRPFCPDQLIDRQVLPIFLLRHLRGGEYNPLDEQGLFVDFQGGWTKWAEEFTRSGFEMDSQSCPQEEGEVAFCPLLLVSRGELLLYLSQILKWDVGPVQGDLFADVRADTPINRAIETAARSGFLAEDDPYCPIRGDGQPFCPEGPARRAFAAVVMVRAFAAAPQYPIVE